MTGPDDPTIEIQPSEETAELDVKVEPPSTPSPMFLFSVVAAFGLLIGLLASQLGSDSIGGTAVASQRAGPEGATLELRTGGELVIPSGALSGEATITVTAGTLPDGTVAYVFGPRELRFDEAVELRIPSHDPDATVVVSVGDRVLHLDGTLDDGVLTVLLTGFTF